MPITPPGSRTTFALELDGTHAGWLASAEGGFAMSDVVEEMPGSSAVGQPVRKTLAGVNYSDIEFDCGANMEPGFYSWINSMLQRKFGWPKDGAVITCDSGMVRSRLTFDNAWISEIRFPAADAASKDTAQLAVKLSPKGTEEKLYGGSVAGPPGPGKGDGKGLLSHFQLKIDGLDCSRVSKVEPVVITTAFSKPPPPPPPGVVYTWEKQPVYLEVSDLVVTLPEAYAQTFRAWHEAFVIRGNSGPTSERSGTLEFLTSMQQTLFTLSFSGLGIYKLAPEKFEAGSENIRRVTAWMYCEGVGLSTAAPAATPGRRPPTPPEQPPAPQPPSPAQDVLSPRGTQREAPGITVAGDHRTLHAGTAD